MKTILKCTIISTTLLSSTLFTGLAFAEENEDVITNNNVIVNENPSEQEQRELERDVKNSDEILFDDDEVEKELRDTEKTSTTTLNRSFPNLIYTNPTAPVCRASVAAGAQWVSSHYKHHYTAALMKRSLKSSNKTHFSSTKSRISKMISNRPSFEKKLKSANLKKIKNKVIEYSGDHLFTSGELFTSIHNYRYSVGIKYLGNDTYSFSGKVMDTYDFELQPFKKTYPDGVTFGNNVMANCQYSGAINSFPIAISVKGTFKK